MYYLHIHSVNTYVRMYVHTNYMCNLQYTQYMDETPTYSTLSTQLKHPCTYSAYSTYSTYSTHSIYSTYSTSVSILHDLLISDLLTSNLSAILTNKTPGLPQLPPPCTSVLLIYFHPHPSSPPFKILPNTELMMSKLTSWEE